MWLLLVFFFFSSRRRHTRCGRDWSSDVCSSDLEREAPADLKTAHVACVDRRFGRGARPREIAVGKRPGAVVRVVAAAAEEASDERRTGRDSCPYRRQTQRYPSDAGF